MSRQARVKMIMIEVLSQRTSASHGAINVNRAPSTMDRDGRTVDSGREKERRFFRESLLPGVNGLQSDENMRAGGLVKEQNRF